MSIEKALKHLNKVWDEEYDTDSGLPEASNRMNNASRKLIEAFKEEKGTAWLWQVNRYDKEKEKICREWDGGLVYNFGADYVTSCYDEELERLMKEREDAPYTGVREDAERLDKIHRRLKEIQGEFLFWS